MEFKTYTWDSIFTPSKGGEEEKSCMVFDSYINKNDLAILFGDSNSGKSILAHDIAFTIGGGGHDWDGLEISKGMSTLYIDLEMTQRQFCQRYLSAKDYIPKTFTRIEIPMSEDDLFSMIQLQIMASQNADDAPKFIVIDNVTSGLGSVQSASKVKAVMCALKRLKELFGLTILLIAHTPKRRTRAEITLDNIGGSKLWANFCDSAFALANTSISNIKYLKQLKTRSGRKSEEVLLLQIQDNPYLSMKIIGKNTESLAMSGTPQYKDEEELTATQQSLIAGLLLRGCSMETISIVSNLPIPQILEWQKKHNINL